ncbi:hypothetical protein SpCBS45565_g08333 [Spizellomyces sp. 'palustris']|nr:hypothetical protein SpCBS45565_g08333 [Spizellomyces sp. 'palustris']
MAMNFGAAVIAKSFDQAVIALFCGKYYQANGGSPEPILGTVDQHDCTIPGVLTPAAEFASMLIVLSTIPSIITILVAGYLSDIFGRKPITIIWLLGQLIDAAMPFVVLHWDLNEYWLAVSKVVSGITGGEATGVTLVVVAVADLTGSKDRARFLAVIQGFGMLAVMGGSLLGGWLVKYTSSFEPTFFLGVLCITFAGVTYVFFVPETRKPARPSEASELSVLSVGKLLRVLQPLPHKIMVAVVLSISMRSSLFFVLPFYAAQEFGWKTWENTLYFVESCLLAAVANLLVLPYVEGWARQMWGSEQPHNLQREVAPLLEDGSRTDDELVVDDNSQRQQENVWRNAAIALNQVRIYACVELVHIILFAISNKAWIVYANAVGSLGHVQARAIILDLVPRESYGIVNSVLNAVATLGVTGLIKASSAIYSATSERLPNAVFILFAGVSTVAFMLVFLARITRRTPI